MSGPNLSFHLPVLYERYKVLKYISEVVWGSVVKD